MLLQVGVRAPDGSDPFALLAASHRRHLSRLRALAHAAAHLNDSDPSQQTEARNELDATLAFFDRASDDPFREEVELLFPILLARSAGDSELEQACVTLGGDRATAAALHTRFANAARNEERATSLQQASDALISLYQSHLERLEGQVFPRALTLLGEDDRRALAERMLPEVRATVTPDAGGPERPDGLGLP